jgi:hypothetical protein
MVTVMIRRYFVIFLLVIGVCLTPTSLRARNVDLSTVPERKTVQLTIYNSEDLTLVRETRVVTFKRGVNPLQFSWANTLIDPTSVELSFRTHGDSLDVLDTTFPHDKPQMLYWNVQSDADQEATIEISYFTSGITWAADYLASADPAEQTLRLEGFVGVQNHSGEDYQNAQVRLVVGTINLVEKIAQLARLPMSRVGELRKDELASFRQQAAKAMLSPETRLASFAEEDAASAPKAIIKEGLSEYFIYTIEGTETVPSGWSKRLRSFTAAAVPLTVQYRYREREYGEQLVRLYLLSNDSASGLGTTPLPDGRVRVFRENGRDGLSYLAAQTIPYVPIGDKLELNLGTDSEVGFALIKRRVFRDAIWMRLGRANLYRPIGDPNLRLEFDSRVAGWDEHQIFMQRIRNYRNMPIAVQVRRAYQGDVTFRSRLDPRLQDYRTVEFSTTLAPSAEVELCYEVIARREYNKKQERVVLERADVSCAVNSK